MKRPSASMVVATIALCVSVVGTGVASSRYLITSTRQIKPSVLASLRGKAGPIGPAGPFPSTLPKGATAEGQYAVQGTAAGPSSIAYGSISWNWPTRSAVQFQSLAKGATPTPQCPGTYLAPRAAPGYLCLYSEVSGNEFSSVDVQTRAAGAVLDIASISSGQFLNWGSWAVTGN